MQATTKPARTVRLASITPNLVYAVVAEGRKTDAYRLDVGYACVRWIHTGDSDRGGNVRVNGAGKATGCDCKAALYGRGCKHRKATEALIAAGRLDVPCVSESREAMAGAPDGWLHNAEGRE